MKWNTALRIRRRWAVLQCRWPELMARGSKTITQRPHPARVLLNRLLNRGSATPASNDGSGARSRAIEPPFYRTMDSALATALYLKLYPILRVRIGPRINNEGSYLVVNHQVGASSTAPVPMHSRLVLSWEPGNSYPHPTFNQWCDAYRILPV